MVPWLLPLWVQMCDLGILTLKQGGLGETTKRARRIKGQEGCVSPLLPEMQKGVYQH